MPTAPHRSKPTLRSGQKVPDRAVRRPKHKHTVRIIGGLYKRTPLPVIDAPGLRPTPDRVRETLFNWLFTLRGGLAGAHCVDAFAGTGALGFEAASRGAARVVMVEQNRALVAQLQAIQTKLQATAVEVRTGDAAMQLSTLAGPFDCVFLDPPYDAKLLPKLLPLLPHLLAPRALVYVEDDAPLAFNGWTLLRHDRAGQIHYGLLQRDNALENGG
jgi:16S rRNA (guanine966-N2)-methyltransferase